MNSICPNNRAGAFQQLEDFLPRVPEYARRRNHVRTAHPDVSRLSAAIRHRLISEEEVIDRVLRAHPFAIAEKFLQEVAWRSYWKGWLEMRPAVWTDYLQELRKLEDSPAGEEARRIIRHGSGNAIIDHFLRELRETGYLHNHARLWFAGWWVHQAGLPWQLGAAHFLDCLLDADPASNTLSWRWVAGRQTPGKHYLARSANLARYLDITDIPGGEEALALFQPTESSAPVNPPIPPPDTYRITRGGCTRLSEPLLVWIHSGDLSVERWLPDLPKVEQVLVGDGLKLEGPRATWLAGAFEDAAKRASRHWSQPTHAAIAGDIADQLLERTRTSGTSHVVSAFIATGPLADQRDHIRGKLATAGIEWHEIHREWDLGIWPLASAGFFPFWKKLSTRLARL